VLNLNSVSSTILSNNPQATCITLSVLDRLKASLLQRHSEEDVLLQQADLGVLRLLRLCLGSAPACSPSAQFKAAVAHVHRLKLNQRKGKLILSIWVFGR
jgi:hypothetical protein